MNNYVDSAVLSTYDTQIKAYIGSVAGSSSSGSDGGVKTITLSSAPTSSTTTYTVDGNTYDFNIGDEVRVASGGSYIFYKLVDLTTSGNTTTASWKEINKDISVMGASGSTHASGLVPDTPTTAGTTKFLREDGTWATPSSGSSSNSITRIETSYDGLTVNPDDTYTYIYYNNNYDYSSIDFTHFPENNRICYLIIYNSDSNDRIIALENGYLASSSAQYYSYRLDNNQDLNISIVAGGFVTLLILFVPYDSLIYISLI